MVRDMSASAVPRIAVILASTREGRRGEGFAKWILKLLSERPGIEVELLDLRDYPIGAYTEAQMPGQVEKAYTDETLRRWSDKIHGLDGFLIVTPEYSHSYPGQLKNAIDHVHTGWWYKPVSFVSYGGSGNGVRAIEHLRGVAIEMRMVPTRGEVNLRLVGLELDETGAPKDAYYSRQAKAMLDQLT